MSSAARVIDRRNFLYTTTAAVAAAGAVMSAWPLVDQMNPDARIRSDVIEVDLTELRPAEQRRVRWRNLPIFVVRRTAAMLDAMQDRAFAAQLVDPDSRTRQQPSYAKNWHRSIDPAFAVLVGICTKCAVVPTFCSNNSYFCVAGGYVCPSCASHYDPAGRAYAGMTPYNLPVPPHSFVGRSKIALGENASDEHFSMEMVEQL